MELVVGGKIKYLKHVDDPLGEGAFGCVYRATHVTTGNTVAIKEMKENGDDKAITQSGLREVVVMTQVRHANVLGLLDVFCDTRQLYLVFEFMDQNLRQYLRTKPHGLHEEQVKKLFHQLVSGLDYAHSRNIAHRDIKPCNILISKDGLHVKIGDWGCARVVGMSSNVFTRKICTLWYRPPEILFGVKIHKTSMDIWSLGCVLAEMVRSKPLFPTKQPPFPEPEDDSRQMLYLFRCLGFPEESAWPSVEQMARYRAYRVLFGHKTCSEKAIDVCLFLKEKVPGMSEAGIHLLSRMIQLCPEKRARICEIKEDAYFY